MERHKFDIESQYLTALNLLRHGDEGDFVFDKADRTGTGTRSTFGTQMSHRMAGGFPMLTTKRVPWRLVVSELLWFLSGSTNINSLHTADNHIWDEWANADGELGPVYGQMWRNWGMEGVDQITSLVERLNTNPDCRRQLVSAWDADVLPEPGVHPTEQAHRDKQALAPCHTMFQTWTYVDDTGYRYLNLKMYQRSADIFLGVPFNIASYALLLEILAKATGMKPGMYFHSFGDLHLYQNHLAQATEQIDRDQKDMPTLEFSKKDAILALKGELKPVDWDRFKLVGYEPHSGISAPVAI